jgi:GNAT superfamily N-acetyltransferase/catechol 2,3-dioxygenase-like lactoylglutathione lyase family enzyme
MLNKSEAIFAVDDVLETIRFYREVLGFDGQWVWGTPPTFGAVRWGQVQVMFCQQPEMKGRVEGHQHMFRADDIQSLYSRHKELAAPIISEIENKPWGMREYTVRDINGYHLRFAGTPTYERPASATDLLPSHIRIEKRLATLDEYVRLTEAVGWTKNLSTMPTALERSLFCIVAIDARDGRAVGMVRACGDGRYYCIWDVVVLPEYQGQKIGTAMMEATLAELRKIGPSGAFVGLFTGKRAFYERLGFVAEGGMHRPL